MKHFLFSLIVFTLSQLSFSQSQLLSERAEISVLTIGPGTSLNDSFGHSGFRVKDPVKGIDLVFNYGIYDFNTPNFYLKFAQGRLHYLCGMNYYEDFYNAYISQNRSIKAQVLNLDATEKQKLFDYLRNNIKPANRRYLYDFFYDNCATKIKDVTNIAVGNGIVFNKPADFKDATFRTLINNNLSANSWGSFGINVALGSIIDRVAPAEDHMFLPENIYRFFEVATVNNKPLVKDSSVIYNKIDTPAATHFFTSPLFVFGMIALVILYITYKDYRNNRRSQWLDVILFSVTGILGVLLLLLWFATDHTGTHQNYNLLWAFPLNLFVIGQLLKPKVSTWFVKYLKLLVILLCLLTLHWMIGVQVFTVGLIPLLIALLVRYVYLIVVNREA
ncbi:lipoprotein N-acyltransferase Lnb domain-containing protein [Aestuariibaculum suncheonense]|uniref:DUF4105 domain-containing protein n=1 Tax=Aestuariibaculum suncheonense TaxID=1028745 RepID=A0A8J6UCR2_9FLAO|nr:DUF4105 domain-containing protein [Aestuariibaculum suncheonense]MBD0836850.1 DUF4105 domain-containing protein [Aestuariibaculum suncheonense]